MKGLGRLGSIFLLIALVSTVPAFAGSVTFTCDSSITTDGPSGLCNYLNSVIAPLYNNTFTNANANIYIEFANNKGLADSFQLDNLVTYSTYESALQAESTDAARAFVPVTEPGIFGNDNVDLTSALAEALGITKVVGGGSVVGITSGTMQKLNGSPCNTFATPGSGCYNGIIQLNIPADLDSQASQGYTYRTLGGSTTGTSNNYDFFSVVEHEADEILGTGSCIDTDNDVLSNPSNCASAVDLFRYTSSGIRTFDTAGTSGYFSGDGGVTDADLNMYTDTANGNDWADFSQNCKFVQDAAGCLNQSFDITTDGPGGTSGPEIAILNAVGYDLVAPEPGTIGLLGLGFAAFGAMGYRHRGRTLA